MILRHGRRWVELHTDAKHVADPIEQFHRMTMRAIAGVLWVQKLMHQPSFFSSSNNCFCAYICRDFLRCEKDDKIPLCDDLPLVDGIL